MKGQDQSLRHAFFDFLLNFHTIFSTKQSPSLKLARGFLLSRFHTSLSKIFKLSYFPVILKIILRTRVVFFFYHIFPIISNIFIICLLTMNLSSQFYWIPIYCRENFLPICVSNCCIVREPCSGLFDKFPSWMDSHTVENARITYTIYFSVNIF